MHEVKLIESGSYVKAVAIEFCSTVSHDEADGFRRLLEYGEENGTDIIEPEQLRRVEEERDEQERLKEDAEQKVSDLEGKVYDWRYHVTNLLDALDRKDEDEARYARENIQDLIGEEKPAKSKKKKATRPRRAAKRA